MARNKEVEVSCTLKQRGKKDRDVLVMMPRHAAERIMKGEQA